MNFPRLLSHVNTIPSARPNSTRNPTSGRSQSRLFITYPQARSNSSRGLPELCPPPPPGEWKLKLPPDSPNWASHAQKPRMNHLPMSNGLKSVRLTRSIAGLMGSVTLISTGGEVVGAMGFTVLNPARAYASGQRQGSRIWPDRHGKFAEAIET